MKRKAYLAHLDAVRSILRTWDPIGVFACEQASIRVPDTEYDSYAPHIVSMLARGCSEADLIAHLGQLRTSAMGLRPEPISDRRSALELRTWWQSLGGPDSIARQA